MRLCSVVHYVCFAANWVSDHEISRRKVNIFWGRGDFPDGAHDILAPPPKPKIGHLRDDVQPDSSKTFGLLHFKLNKTSSQIGGKTGTLTVLNVPLHVFARRASTPALCSGARALKMPSLFCILAEINIFYSTLC